MAETKVNELMTGPEAAEFLRVSPQTLPRWRFDGTGPAFVRVGRKILYRRADLEEYVRRRVVRIEEKN